ncbi:YwmB family TATA-box binding protein [Peribacillus asahii]|uniref:YwmB family TATA-box binding protein n=1 Tax=Peribacillus asahii TaxID=228899 RepID=UPI00207ACBBF|nr:YwmB family TATA-box binding protein [Peribacillus asahii]USK62455.1 YwmB family TATA-box binding protein [Peribacillus asahii]
MLKKSMSAIFIAILFTVSILINGEKVDSFFNKNELLEITDVAKQQNIEIKRWSMYIKKPIVQYDRIENVKNKIDNIQEEEDGFTWTKEQFQDDYYKIIGQKKDNITNISEKILIIYFPFNNQYSLSVTYDVEGNGWNEKNWGGISKRYESEIDKFSVFYTVEGTTKVKKSLNTEANNLLKSFSGKIVESLNEGNFVSLSAYTNQWNTKLSLGKQKFMNLHIAYRNSNDFNGITNVTIGTPIITSEY